MGRYRPPRPPSSPYITRAGYERLQAELTHLWKEKRPAVTAKVAEAAALGDRSENAEYIYGKRQLREIDARIQYLSKRLDALEIIDRRPAQADRIFFGATVVLEDEVGEARRFRIVGADEIGAPMEGDAQPISIDAPLARRLIGRHIDDEVTYEHDGSADTRIYEPQAKGQIQRYVVVDISYP